MKNKIKIISLITLFIILVGCNNGSQSSSVISSSFINSNSSSSSLNSSISSSDEITPYMLADDILAIGKYDNIPNQNRYPSDELYDKIQAKKSILNAGETYIEDFEKDFLDTRVYVYKGDKNVNYSINSSGNCRINGKSLCIASDGNYQGVYFAGMKFANNGTYEISLKYKILVASNDFIFQFRSRSGGIASDVFTIISGSSGQSGVLNHIFDLKDYADYEIMIFPRDNKGTIAIDDISITRNNTKPQIKSASINGELKTGSTLTFDYTYFDAENDTELRTEYRWFTSIDQNGLNKTILNNTSSSLLLENSMIGKFIGVELVPYSIGDTIHSKGNIVNIYTNTTINQVAPNIGNVIYLDFNQSFTEDFEAEINVDGNLFFEGEDDVNTYITMDQDLVIDGDKSLIIRSNGSYKGDYFSGIRFAKNGIYEISFDYILLDIPSNFYVQLRSTSGGIPTDKYVDMSISDKVINQQYQFKGQFGLDGYNDYYLMMFPSSKGVEIIIDNIKVTRLEGFNTEVINKELNVGDKIFEDFNDRLNPQLGVDNAQVPNSKITNDSLLSIDGYSLYIESDGSYKCLFINKGIIYQDNATYRVSFDYKILSFVDTIYIQFNSNNQNVYEQFGGFTEVGITKSFNHEFSLSSATNCLIQIFPGGGIGKTSVIIDNIEIERIN